MRFSPAFGYQRVAAMAPAASSRKVLWLEPPNGRSMAANHCGVARKITGAEEQSFAGGRETTLARVDHLIDRIGQRLGKGDGAIARNGPRGRRPDHDRCVFDLVPHSKKLVFFPR